MDRHKDAALSVMVFWMKTELVRLLTCTVTMPYPCKRSKKFINFVPLVIFKWTVLSSKLSHKGVYEGVYLGVYVVEPTFNCMLYKTNII